MIIVLDFLRNYNPNKKVVTTSNIGGRHYRQGRRPVMAAYIFALYLYGIKPAGKMETRGNMRVNHEKNLRDLFYLFFPCPPSWITRK